MNALNIWSLHFFSNTKFINNIACSIWKRDDCDGGLHWPRYFKHFKFLTILIYANKLQRGDSCCCCYLNTTLTYPFCSLFINRRRSGLNAQRISSKCIILKSPNKILYARLEDENIVYFYLSTSGIA